MCQAEKGPELTAPAAPEASEPETELLAEAKAAGLFLDRELSWLQFNRRVLEQAGDPTVPLWSGSNSSVFTARIWKSFSWYASARSRTARRCCRTSGMKRPAARPASR